MPVPVPIWRPELKARKVGQRRALHVVDVLVRCRAFFNMWASVFSSLKIKERGGREGEERWKREKKRSEGKKKGGREDWGGDIEEGEKKSVSERRTCGTTYVNTDILTRLCVTGSGGAPGPLLGR